MDIKGMECDDIEIRKRIKCEYCGYNNYVNIKSSMLGDQYFSEYNIVCSSCRNKMVINLMDIANESMNEVEKVALDMSNFIKRKLELRCNCGRKLGEIVNICRELTRLTNVCSYLNKRVIDDAANIIKRYKSDVNEVLALLSVCVDCERRDICFVLGSLKLKKE